MEIVLALFFFFFQAEDGIRDTSVTGVQTCALPIFRRDGDGAAAKALDGRTVAIAPDAYVHRWTELRSQPRTDLLPRKIGRASCRERVSMPEHRVSLKTKTRRHGR